jgi:hypothetical protein
MPLKALHDDRRLVRVALKANRPFVALASSCHADSPIAGILLYRPCCLPGSQSQGQA